MKTLIKPIQESRLVQVDGDDIWWNLRDIKKAINKIDNLKKESSTINVYTESYITPYTDMKVQYQWGGTSGTSTHSEADEQNQQENVRKIDEIKDVIGQCTRSMRDQIEFMEQDFNKYIAPFRNLDDDYASRTNPIYNKYSSNEEMRQNERTFEKKEAKMLAEAIWNSFKGTAELGKGIINYGAGAYVLGKSKLKGSRISGEDEKYINSFMTGNGIVKELIKDPYLIVEGVAQQTSDDLDQKGISYVVGTGIGDFAQFKAGELAKIKAMTTLSKGVVGATEAISKIKNVSSDFLGSIKGSIIDLGDMIAYEPILIGAPRDTLYYMKKTEIKDIDKLERMAKDAGRLNDSACETIKEASKLISMEERISEYQKIMHNTKVKGTYTDSEPASNILRNELYDADITKPPYMNAAHHIVAFKEDNAEIAREILGRYDIDVNSATNGVLLPCRKNPYVTTEAMHSGGHLKEYFTTVNDRLKRIEKFSIEKKLNTIETKMLMCEELQNIRKDLLNGELKIHN